MTVSYSYQSSNFFIQPDTSDRRRMLSEQEEEAHRISGEVAQLRQDILQMQYTRLDIEDQIRDIRSRFTELESTEPNAEL